MCAILKGEVFVWIYPWIFDFILAFLSCSLGLHLTSESACVLPDERALSPWNYFAEIPTIIPMCKMLCRTLASVTRVQYKWWTTVFKIQTESHINSALSATAEWMKRHKYPILLIQTMMHKWIRTGQLSFALKFRYERRERRWKCARKESVCRVF